MQRECVARRNGGRNERMRDKTQHPPRSRDVPVQPTRRGTRSGGRLSGAAETSVSITTMVDLARRMYALAAQCSTPAYLRRCWSRAWTWYQRREPGVRLSTADRVVRWDREGRKDVIRWCPFSLSRTLELVVVVLVVSPYAL